VVEHWEENSVKVQANKQQMVHKQRQKHAIQLNRWEIKRK